MKDTKLVIVTGMSGVGKSTTTQNLARLYQHNNLNNTWYHEEMEAHPIRWANGGEFRVGSLLTEEGMQQNIADIYHRWRTLLAEITGIGGTHLMEGCLFENIMRYFFKSHYTKDKIIAYYDELIKILEPANSTIIFLYRPDVEANLRKAFEVRGDPWKNLILNPEGDLYLEKHGYVGEESIYSMWEDYQNLAHVVFERYQGNKIKIDTSGEEWDSYLQRMAAFLNIKYFDRETFSLVSPNKYCGRFFFQYTDGTPEVIEVTCENDTLFCRFSWFKTIKMIPSGNDVFELSSFPINFSYHYKDGQKFIDVSGNYGWEIIGKTLMEYKL